MKYVFFGTPEFAATVLKKLMASGFVPEAVVCNPDRPTGRKKIITSPPVKRLMANRKEQIEILQPDDIKTINNRLSAIRPDFFIVAAYAKILTKETIDIPRLGAIGVHPSLLPKYRGASPIQGAILEGEKETGVTLYLMDEKTDHGPIIAQQKLEFTIYNLQFTKLLEKLAELAGDLLVEILPKFAAGEIKLRPQDESRASYTKKFATKDAFIDEKKLGEAIAGENPAAATEIYRKILAFTPEPGVWTTRDGKRVKLLEAETENGKLNLKKIQTEGEKPKTVWGGTISGVR